MNESLGYNLPDYCVPKLAPGIRLHIDRLTGQPLLLFPEAVMELKGSSSAIVPLCDGLRTFGEMVAYLSQQFAAPEAVIRDDVARFLLNLRERQLVKWEDVSSSTSIASAPSDPVTLPAGTKLSPGVSRPLGLIAELSYRCPLHCPYCSNPTAISSTGTELTTAAWERVLGEAAEIGVLHAMFTGGEPLVRTDLESLISHAHAVGLYTNLITSAVGFTPQRARSLRAAHLESVQISFQSDREELADSIAGSAAHSRKLEAARIARDYGFPLTINVVLHRANIDRIAGIIEMASELGARRLELANAQYYGWAMRNRSALIPTRTQVAAARRIATHSQHRYNGQMDILFIVPDYFSDFPKPCMNGWGKQYIAVNPFGDVLPCPTAAEIPSLQFDNVGKRSLSWIWSNSEAFNRFRGTSWMPDPCRTCDRREIDFGGCRCQAALLTGDASQTDPVCTFSPHRNLIDHALSVAETMNPTEKETYVFRTNPLRARKNLN